jgi:hypothetical protein
MQPSAISWQAADGLYAYGFANIPHHPNFHLDRKNRKSISSKSQKIKLQPRPVQPGAGAGDPSFRGEFLMVLNVEINQDRALSSPSPTANLAGIWKGYDSDHKPPVFCRWFFYCPSPGNRPIAE